MDNKDNSLKIVNNIDNFIFTNYENEKDIYNEILIDYYLNHETKTSLYNIGVYYITIENYMYAEIIFKRIVKKYYLLTQEKPTVYFYLGYINLKYKQYQNAIKFYKYFLASKNIKHLTFYIDEINKLLSSINNV